MTAHLTITLSAPRFSSRPGWTAAEVVNFIENSLADGCDLPGLAVIEAVES